MKNKINSTLVCLLCITLAGWMTPAQCQNWEWAKAFGGSSGAEKADDVCTDASGNVYTCGDFLSSSITIGSNTLTNNSSPGNDIFLAKTDASGSVLWAKSFGGSSTEWAHKVQCDAQGNVFMCGSYGSVSLDFGNGISLANPNGPGSLNYFVVKFNASGVAQWAKTATPDASCQAVTMILDADGNVYVTGSIGAISTAFNTGADTLLYDNSNSHNSFLVKFSNSGTFRWVRRFAGDIIGSSGDGGADALAIDAAKNIYTVGTYDNFSSPFDEKELFIAKYDSNGLISWLRNFGSDERDYGFGIALDPQGNILITGMFEGATLTMGSNSISNVTTGEFCRYAAKFDKDGNNLWLKKLANAVPTCGRNIVVDAQGNSYIGGYGVDTMIVGVPAAYWDAVVMKLNANGAVQWSIAGGNGFMGAFVDDVYGLALDGNGDVLVCGQFGGNQSVPSRFGNIVLNDLGSYDAYVAKIKTSGPNAVTTTFQNVIKAWPNPANDYLMLEIPSELTGTTFTISDITGKQCLNGCINQQHEPISLHTMAAGMYQLQVTNNKGELLFTGKVAKQ